MFGQPKKFVQPEEKVKFCQFAVMELPIKEERPRCQLLLLIYWCGRWSEQMRALRKLSLCVTLSFAPMVGMGCVSGILQPRTPSRSTEWQASLDEARAAEYKQDWEAARRGYLKAHRQNPGNFESLHRLGVVCSHLKQFKDADSYFREAYTLSPDNPALLADMGFSSFQRNDYARAESFLERSVRLNDKDTQTVNNLAIARAWNCKDELSLSTFMSVNDEKESYRLLNAVRVARGSTPSTPLNSPAPTHAAAHKLASANANRGFDIIPVFPASSTESKVAIGGLPPLSNVPTNEMNALYSIELPPPSKLEQVTKENPKRTDKAVEPGVRQVEPGTGKTVSLPPLPSQSSPRSQPLEIPPKLPVLSELPPLPPLSEIAIPGPAEEHTLIPPVPSVERSIALDRVETPVEMPKELPKKLDLPLEPVSRPQSISIPPLLKTASNTAVTHPRMIEDLTPPNYLLPKRAEPQPIIQTLEPVNESRPVTAWRKTQLPIGAASDTLVSDEHGSSVRQISAVSEIRSDADVCRICLVTLYDQRLLTHGESDYRAAYRSRIYQFATRDARDRFVLDPERFVPAAGGVDLVCAANGQGKAQGLFNFAFRYENRLYLFSTADNGEEFQRNPQHYVIIGSQIK